MSTSFTPVGQAGFEPTTSFVPNEARYQAAPLPVRPILTVGNVHTASWGSGKPFSQNLGQSSLQPHRVQWLHQPSIRRACLAR